MVKPPANERLDRRLTRHHGGETAHGVLSVVNVKGGRD
jgi:hypothetical protein